MIGQKRNYRVEKTWKSHGYKCIVLMTSMGHRCGYVGIPQTHPLYNQNYNEHSKYLLAEIELLKNQPIGKRGIIPVFCWDGIKASPEIAFDVHGGLTFSGGNEGYPIKSKEPIWWFGYDCAHNGDSKDINAIKNKKTREFEKELQIKYPTNGIIRSLEYCIQECENLAYQLSLIDSFPPWFNCFHYYRPYNFLH